jgi:hypothetical protein
VPSLDQDWRELHPIFGIIPCPVTLFTFG